MIAGLPLLPICPTRARNHKLMPWTRIQALQSEDDVLTPSQLSSLADSHRDRSLFDAKVGQRYPACQYMAIARIVAACTSVAASTVRIQNSMRCQHRGNEITVYYTSTL